MDDSGDTKPTPQAGTVPGPAAAASPSRQGLTLAGLPGLAWVFLRIGATAFGGLGATLALVERELVDRRKVLSAADVTEALTYTKLLPGSTGVQVVGYLGYRLGGWTGSAMATAAFLLPAAALMTALAVTYVAASALPDLEPAIRGLTAAVVGVLLATTYRLGKSSFRDPVLLALTLAAFGAGVVFNVNAALIVVAAGLIGLLLFASPARRKEPSSRRQKQAK